MSALLPENRESSLTLMWIAYQRTKVAGVESSSKTSTGFLSPYWRLNCGSSTVLESEGAGVVVGLLNARYYEGSRGQFLSQDPSFLDIGAAGFEQNYERTLPQHLANPQALNSYSYGLNNPLTNKDPGGEIVPLVLAAYAAFEIGLSVYDAYNAFQTVNNQNASSLEKGAAVSGFAAGLIAPGGGYGTVAKTLVGQSFGKLGTVINNTPGKITGFTEHGINQVINRNVTPTMLRDTTKNPTVILQQAGGNKLYLTNQAAVVLNKNGQVVTSYSAKEFQPHVQNVLKQAASIKKK